MLYWNEIINDLAKILTSVCSTRFLSLYDEVTDVLCVSLLSHDRYQYNSLILSKQTWTYPLAPKIAGSNPAEAVGFFSGVKNPKHAFLRKGSRAVGPVS
jgi:hypothetical protein